MTKWSAPLLAFVVFCSLAVAVGFPWKQAVLLAVLVAYVERGLGDAAVKPMQTFEPYCVWIIPNWSQILTDFTIVKNDEDWRKFIAWCGRTELPVAWHSVLRNDKDGVLIYCGSELGFSTAFDWLYKVMEREWLRGTKREINPDGFPDSMDFFVKQKFDVIQLGLKVSRDWWQTFSRHCPEPLETHEEYIFGQVSIVLAQLPLREFDLYWNDVDYKTKNVDKTWKSVRESRKKHGWEEIERDEEFPYGQPIKITNKYFEVRHHSIGSC